MKALVVEADSSTRQLFLRVLASAGCELLSCTATSEVRSAFESFSPDIVVLAFDEPQDTSLAFCRWVRSLTPGNSVWILGVSAHDEPVTAVNALQAGANDFTIRPLTEAAIRLRLLTATKHLQQAYQRLEEQHAEDHKRDVRAQQQTAIAALAQCALVGMELGALLNQALTFVAQTIEADYTAAFQLLADKEQLLLIDGTGLPEAAAGRVRVMANSQTIEGQALRVEPAIVVDWELESRFQKPLGGCVPGVHASLSIAVPGPSGPFGVLSAHTIRKRIFSEDDIRFLKGAAIVLSLAIERDRRERAIQRLAAFARCNPNPVLEFNANGDLTYANAAAEEMAHSIGRGSVLGMLPEDYAATISNCLTSGRSHLHQPTALGRRTLLWSFFPIHETNAVHAYAEEITQRQELENQLRQLQKMECVGRLAAGLAHDFNNILTIIRGHADLALSDQMLPEKKIASVKKVVGATERASGLTRQLLTFSRQQVLEPAPLDLNECVYNLTKMLDRVLGDNIDLKFEPGANLPAALGDAGMLDQIVMNLAVNARDAMPQGGRLVVATSLVEVDEDHVRRRPEARPGVFACLSVTDTGCGMDEKTLVHIFEPFFTTKGVGKGTGLGLATVYGIVKQHSGWIEVISEVGRGTTFLIFLPCADAAKAAPQAPGRSDDVRGGNETILLVEDEPTLRELARMILQNFGYKIIEASSGAQALKLWQKEKQRIDLLFTDVVMPEGVSGTELGQRLLAEKPALKVIYTSGYGREIMGQAEAQNRLLFLQKPFAPQKLAKAVRDGLDAN